MNPLVADLRSLLEPFDDGAVVILHGDRLSREAG
jgi:hypothetical protein